MDKFAEENKAAKTLTQIRKAALSLPFMLATVGVGGVFLVYDKNVGAALFYMFLISALLVICDDLLACLLPFLSLSLSVLRCYDSYDVFIKYLPLAIVPASALLLNIILYRKKPEIGPSFFGVLAVSLALGAGGIGEVSRADYFRPASLFYIFALGIGMCLAYLLLKSGIRPKKNYDINEKFISIMYMMGVFACFQVLLVTYNAARAAGLTAGEAYSYFSRPINAFTQRNSVVASFFQPSNNYSTFLMLALPFPFYRAAKNNPAHSLMGVVMMVCIYITKSRGGLIFGSIEFALCIIFAALLLKNRAAKIFWGVVGALALAASGFLIFSLYQVDLVSKEEARFSLLYRSFYDFLKNPVFGIGVGSRINSDLYAGKKGTIIWYHMMLPQIYGSMGAFGVVSYAVEFGIRVKLVFKKLSPYVGVYAMSYLGLLLMSQVNPGEFCPLPYGVLAVLLFIFIENAPSRAAKTQRKLS